MLGRFLILPMGLCSLACAGGPGTLPARDGTFYGITILAHSERPVATSGVLEMWVVLEGAAENGNRGRLYMRYLDNAQFIPPVNSICNIVVHKAYVTGQADDAPVDVRAEQMIVDSLSCDTSPRDGQGS